MSDGYTKTARAASLHYFKEKYAREAMNDVERLRYELWATLNLIYGPNPQYRKIDQ